jgi:hypothetical protein
VHNSVAFSGGSTASGGDTRCSNLYSRDSRARPGLVFRYRAFWQRGCVRPAFIRSWLRVRDDPDVFAERGPFRLLVNQATDPSSRTRRDSGSPFPRKASTGLSLCSALSARTARCSLQHLYFFRCYARAVRSLQSGRLIQLRSLKSFVISSTAWKMYAGFRRRPIMVACHECAHSCLIALAVAAYG